VKYKLIAGQVVFGITRIIPQIEDVHVKGREEALLGSIMAQREHVLRLRLDLVSVVAILNPGVLPDDHDLPERWRFVQSQAYLLTGAIELFEVAYACPQLAPVPL